MQQYKAIIVDDEVAQQELLTMALEEDHPNIKICAICADADAALLAVATHQPHLVFLDVNMPGKSGIEFLQQFPEIPFDVIFASAHQEYAIDAFELSAVHYLSKPVSAEMLTAAIERFIERQAYKEPTIHLRNLLHNYDKENEENQKIAITTVNGFEFIEISKIAYCESTDRNTILFLLDKSQQLIYRTLKECDKILTPHKFLRVHKRFLVNSTHIIRYHKKQNKLELSNRIMLEVSRSKGDFLDNFPQL